MLIYFILLCALTVGFTSSASLPSYLKKCSKTKDLDACALKHGREAIPTLLKGDKSYRVPPLVPIFVPMVSIDANTLKITLKDNNVYGLENVDLRKINFDINAQKVTFKANVPILSFIGKYNMSGKILVLPLQGDGPYNVTAVDGEYEYVVHYKLEKKQGQEYMVLQDDSKLDFIVGKAIFKFDNLFNGDEKLGEQMNKWLNENWKLTVDEIGGVVTKAVSSIMRSILTGIMQTVPYEEVFLD